MTRAGRESAVDGTTRHGQPRRRRLRIAAGVLVLAVGCGFGTAGAANARSLNGWAWSHNSGQTQLYTTLGDTSTYISKARVQHLHAVGFATTYCGAQAKVTGTLSSGASWTRTFGYQPGCWFVMVDEVIAPNVYLKAGSSFSGQAYHDGAWSPGSASIRA